MPPLRVVICTNRPPADVLPCVRELAAQGLPSADLLLVASGLDEAAARAHEEALATLLPGARVIAEPRPGLSLARNAALAACADGEVLAFIDDDAIPGEGWLAGLRVAWDAAPARVAVVGGPIRPRFLAPRPDWLADGMLPVLTVLDYGAAPLDLDPEVRTLYGANVSFRVEALRSVGGFDPSLGHQGGRTFFGEEDEVERALARSGLVIRYEPRVWVWHLVPPRRLTRREVLRRRFHYGVSLGRRGGRTPGRALRAVLRSAAAVPFALAAGEQPRAMERAFRASENTGVLLWRAITPRGGRARAPSRPTPDPPAGRPDVLLVSPGTTAGWRRADAELARALEELGVRVAVCTTDFRFARHLRRGMLMTDLVEAGALRRAIGKALRRQQPRAIIFSSPQATMLLPRRLLDGATAVRFDAPAAVNRTRFGGALLHALERRALSRVRLLLPWGLAPSADQDLDVETPMVALPTPVELRDGEAAGREPIAIAYAGDPGKKGLDLAVEAWAAVAPSGWRLVVTGVDPEAGRRFLRRRGIAEPEGLEWAGVLDHERYRALIGSASIFLAASRYEDYGLAQLEALAAGCFLVTVPSDGPFAALEEARALDPRLVADEVSAEALVRALEVALGLGETGRRAYAARARELVRPYSREALAQRLSQDVLPVLLPTA